VEKTLGDMGENGKVIFKLVLKEKGSVGLD
jgi:hypothetical protein